MMSIRTPVLSPVEHDELLGMHTSITRSPTIDVVASSNQPSTSAQRVTKRRTSSPTIDDLSSKVNVFEYTAQTSKCQKRRRSSLVDQKVSNKTDVHNMSRSPSPTVDDISQVTMPTGHLPSVGYSGTRGRRYSKKNSSQVSGAMCVDMSSFSESETTSSHRMKQPGNVKLDANIMVLSNVADEGSSWVRRNSLPQNSSLSGLPLTCHLSKRHTPTKSERPTLFSCDRCEFETIRLENIVTHQRLLHSPQKLYDGCDRSMGPNMQANTAADVIDQVRSDKHRRCLWETAQKIHLKNLPINTNKSHSSPDPFDNQDITKTLDPFDNQDITNTLDPFDNQDITKTLDPFDNQDMTRTHVVDCDDKHGDVVQVENQKPVSNTTVRGAPGSRGRKTTCARVPGRVVQKSATQSKNEVKRSRGRANSEKRNTKCGASGRGRGRPPKTKQPERKRPKIRLPSMDSSGEGLSLNSTLPLISDSITLDSTSLLHETDKVDNVTMDPGPDISDDSDDDSGLPDMLSSSQQAQIEVGDLLWVRAYGAPFWPVVVKKVYHQKNKIKKFSVGFIQKNVEQRQSRCLSCLYMSKKVIPFGGNHELHQRLLKEAQETSDAEVITESVEWVEEYLYMKARGEVNCSVLQFFGFSHLDKEDSDEDDLKDEENDLDLINEPIEEKQEVIGVSKMADLEEISLKLKLCLEKRLERCQKLIDYCKTDTIKEYMKDIMTGTQPSHRRDLFNKPSNTPDEKKFLKATSFGPVEDDSQQNDLVDVLSGHFRSISGGDTSYKEMEYFTQVLIPETIIYAIQAAFRRSRAKAEEIFTEGFLSTKEELRIQEQIMFREKLTDEEQGQVQRRLARTAQRMGIAII